MTLSTEQHLALIVAADQRLLGTLAGLTDEQAGQPSALRGWTRGHLLSHLARNADGLRNLLRWARTGIVTPMYREPDGRDADIQAGAARPAAELVADVERSAQRWLAAARELADRDWQVEIRRRPTSDPEPARKLLDGRLFEVEFHHVDLGLGYGFADSPQPLLGRALAYTQGRLRPPAPFLAVLAGSGDQLRFPPEPAEAPALQVRGEPAALLGWLAGRSRGTELEVAGGELPVLPPWG